MKIIIFINDCSHIKFGIIDVPIVILYWKYYNVIFYYLDHGEKYLATKQNLVRGFVIERPF